MMGVNTRVPNYPPGVIHHTPVAELFSPNNNAKVWFAGSVVPATDHPPTPSEDGKALIDEILTRAAVLFPQYPRTTLLLTTRTLPAYPISSWPSGTTPIGRGTSRSSPTTHGALVSVLPSTPASSNNANPSTSTTANATILHHFRTTQPFNHVHQGDDDAGEQPTLLCLHLASVPGRDEDEWVLSDIARDLRRGWKKNMVRVGERGSQRVWASMADGRHVRPVVSYNDVATRPFEDARPDL